MTTVVSIDPGLFKCGIVIADLEKKVVNEAIVIDSNFLLKFLKNLSHNEVNPQLIIGNGTGSKKFINILNQHFTSLIIVDEKNSTLRAKARYFEIFPLKGIRAFLPREIFIMNKNLDALAALIIMEEYFKYKFVISKSVNFKTWLK